MQEQIGVTLEEKVKNSLQLGSTISTRNIGALMERERGVANKPVLITSNKEDSLIFGGYNTSMYSPYVMKHLFENLGGYGVNIYGIRIVGAGCVAAYTTVQNAFDDTQALTQETTQVADVSNPQITEVTVSGVVDTGDIYTITYSGDDVTYVALEGDTLADVAAGLNTAIGDFQTANPASDWANDLTSAYVALDEFLTITAVANNTPFALTLTATNVLVTPENIFKLTAGRQGNEDVGTWGNDLSVKVYPIGDPNGSANKYRMQIYYKNTLVETYEYDNWQDMETAVNQQSDYVMMTPSSATSYDDYDLVGVPFIADFANGAYTAPTVSEFEPDYNSTTQDPEGLAIFEQVDAQVLFCPEDFSLAFYQKCDLWCRNNKKFFVANMPYLATESQLTNMYNGLTSGSDESYIATYLNWCEVDDNLTTNGRIWIPALGYVIGSGYVKASGLNGGFAWIPPAGIQTRAYGAYRFTHDTLTDATLSRYATVWHCNSIKFVKNVGYCIWSSRTQSDNELFHSAHIRLESNWLAASLLERGNKFVQLLIGESFLKSVKLDYRSFMQNIYNQGGIENTIPFDKAVVITVEVDATNRKKTNIDVAWIPPECNEHLHITMSRNDGVLSLV